MGGIPGVGGLIGGIFTLIVGIIILVLPTQDYCLRDWHMAYHSGNNRYN